MKTIRVVAAVIKSVDKDGEPIIFATQRGYGDLKGGWEFPGGKIEEGETPEEALRREIMEELDTEVKVGNLIDTIEYDYPTFHLSMDCFWCKIVKGDLVLKEHESAKWLRKYELDSVDWLPADITLIDKIKASIMSKAEVEERRIAKRDKRLALKALRDAKAAKELAKKEAAQQKKDIKYMKAAIRQAKKAYALGEVPIGCVIVKDDKIIASGYNRRNTDRSTLAHAEITAIKKASKKIKDWRLSDCTLYVTLEPCQMCAGAIVQARTTRVVMASMNPKAGCAGSVINLLQMKGFNHTVDLTTGVLDEECSKMLSDFFEELRKSK